MAGQNQLNTEALTMASKTSARVDSLEKHFDRYHEDVTDRFKAGSKEMKEQGRQLIKIKDDLIDKMENLADKFQTYSNRLLWRVIAALGVCLGSVIAVLIKFLGN